MTFENIGPTAARQRTQLAEILRCQCFGICSYTQSREGTFENFDLARAHAGGRVLPAVDLHITV